MLNKPNRPTLAQLVERLTVDVTNLIWKKVIKLSPVRFRQVGIFYLIRIFKILINYILIWIITNNIKIHKGIR
jgi:hypothetical protein